MNGWASWALGLLASLVLGSYLYTYAATIRIEDTLIARLVRIEQKLDCLVDRRLC